MKFKKAVSIGLITVMACGMLTACSKDGINITFGTQTESEADQNDDTGREEATTEESKEEVSSEDTQEESGAEESAEESDKTFGEVNVEWSEHYKNFFDNYDTNHIMIDARVEYEDENVNMSMIIGMGVVDDNSFFKFGIDAGNGENSVTMYDSDDGYTYLEESFAGAEKVCVKAKSEGNEEAAFDGISSDETFGLDDETASKIVYDHEEEIGGVIYDVLVAEVDDSKAFYYVNRSTQELERISVPYENDQVLECVVTRIDKIDMPTATEEISSDEFGEKLGMDIMAIIFSSMDLSAFGDE